MKLCFIKAITSCQSGLIFHLFPNIFLNHRYVDSISNMIFGGNNHFRAICLGGTKKFDAFTHLICRPPHVVIHYIRSSLSYLQLFWSHGHMTSFTQLKRHSAIGTGDFSYTCHMARHKSTNFPDPNRGLYSLSPYHACFKEMPHSGFAAHLGFWHNASLSFNFPQVCRFRPPPLSLSNKR